MLSSCSQNITTTACLAIPVFEARKPVSAGLVQCSWLLVLNISSSPPFSSFSSSPAWHPSTSVGTPLPPIGHNFQLVKTFDAKVHLPIWRYKSHQCCAMLIICPRNSLLQFQSWPSCRLQFSATGTSGASPRWKDYQSNSFVHFDLCQM